jgi:hypothetical protein
MDSWSINSERSLEKHDLRLDGEISGRLGGGLIMNGELFKDII